MSYTSHTRADLSTSQRMMTDAIAIFLSTHKIPESDRELLIEAGKIIAKAKPKDSTQSQTKSYIKPTKEEESAIDKIVRAVMAAKRLDAEGSTKAYAKWERAETLLQELVTARSTSKRATTLLVTTSKEPSNS